MAATTTATLTPIEIEFGKLAIERGLVTRDQMRECADQRAAGVSDHVAKMLVSRGVMAEGSARALLTEVNARSGSGPTGSGVFALGAGGQPGSGTGFGAGAQPGSGTGFGAGSAHGTHGAGIVLACPSCGARVTAYAQQAVQRIRCTGCAGAIQVPGGPGQTNSMAGSQRGPAPTAGYGTNGGGAPAGPHGTHRQAGGAPGYQQPQGYAAPGSGGFQDPNGSGRAPTGGGFQADSKPAAEPPPSNIAADDPIAQAMATRQNADGSVETVFGPYDILGEIARGGMGIVYRARQRSLKRIVALKVMKEGENASEKQIRRFKRETEAAAKLQHPNIVAVHEVGCHQGFHYFTMDLIEGDPLDAIVKRGEKMPVERVLQIVCEIAQAIHYAHGKSIIHRDMKPANVLLDTDGHPKVTDFGLAKNVDHKSMLTRTGAVVGTPFYMPPEQARGDVDIDGRADVYAMGVILYELLTLKLPFHGETTMEVYHKILEEEPLPPRKHDSRINADVNTIVLKAMDKDMTRRYQTSQDLAEDIQRYLAGDAIKARPLGPIGLLIKKAKKNMPVVIVASVTALALVGGMALIYWRHLQRIRIDIEVNRQHEWDTYNTEVGNQCINARSQIQSAQARLRERDPDGAIVDLQESLRILKDLPLLVGDFQQWNTPERLEGFLVEKKPEVDQIFREAWLELGRAHVTKGDPKSLTDALACFASGLEHDQGSPDGLGLRLEVGKVEALQGKLDKALQTFKAILEKDAAHVDARLEMGRVHDLAGDYPAALDCFTHVVERAPKPIRAHLLRGQTRFTLGRHEEAFADFDKLLELKEDHFEGYVWRGRTHQALGHMSEAQEDLTEAIDLNPSMPDGYYYRAELCAAQRKHAEAIKDYEVAISRSAQFFRAYLGLGKALEWVLDYERARQQYDEVLAATSREAVLVQPEAHEALAELLLVQSDALECLQECEDKARAANATPDGAPGPIPPLGDLRKDSEVLRAQRLKDAGEALARALELDADLVPALLCRARLAIVEGKPDAARTDLAAALKALDQRPSVRFASTGAGPNRANKPVEEDEDDWDTDADTSQGGEEVPLGDVLLADAHALLGLVALQAGQHDQAKQSFQRAASASPSCALAVAGLGHVALAAKDTRAATEHFVKARRLAAEGKDEAQFFHQEGVRYQGLASRSKKPEYFKQARQCFARASGRDPLCAMASLERARLAAEWSGFDPAVILAGRATEADPKLREAFELLGFLFARDLPAERDPRTGRPENVRDPARAEKHFDEAIAVAGDKKLAADAFYGRALARLAGVNLSKAEWPTAAGPDVSPFTQPGGEVKRPRVELARDDLKLAQSSIPADFKTAEPRQISQAIAYLEELARVQKMLGDVAGAAEATAEVEKVRKAAREAADVELNEGKTLRDRLNYAEAIKHFDRAIELFPEYPEAYYERGTCYLKIGNFVPGILDFSRALELNPRIADQVYNKVYQISYVVDLNRVITELNKIVADHPSVSYVIFLRGFFYVAKTEFKRFERSDLDMGISDFNRCLELNPGHVTALLYRGFLFHKMASLAPDAAGRQECYDKAMGDYLHALELDAVSGISHYLQALTWSVMSTEEGLPEAEAAERRRKSIEQLRTSFNCDFKGYERIKNERGFDAVKNDPEFLELMRGK